MKAGLSCLVIVASLSNSGQLAAQAACRITVPVIALASGPTNGFAANDLRATVKDTQASVVQMRRHGWQGIRSRQGTPDALEGVRGRQVSPAIEQSRG